MTEPTDTTNTQSQTPPAPDAQNPTPPEEPQQNPNASVQARVLMHDVVEGVTYQPNTFVQFKAKLAEPLEKAGRIDTSSEAIAYCKKAGLEKVVHEDAKKALNAPKAKKKGSK